MGIGKKRSGTFATLPTGPREDAFLVDTRDALDPVVAGLKEPAPSFERFRQALIEGRLFAIVTARGHRDITLRRGVECFYRAGARPTKQRMLHNLRLYKEAFGEPHDTLSDAEILDGYLSLNRYHAVTVPEFRRRMSRDFPARRAPRRPSSSPSATSWSTWSPSCAARASSAAISVGFSDDDPGNVRAVKRFISAELGHALPVSSSWSTTPPTPSRSTGHKIVVQGQLELGLDV